MSVTIIAPTSRVVPRGTTRLTWSSTYPQSAYEIQYREVGQTAWQTFGRVTTTTQTVDLDVSKLRDMVEYHFRVVVYHVNSTSGTSIYNGSDISTAYSLIVTPKQKLATLKAKYGSKMVEVPLYDTTTNAEATRVQVANGKVLTAPLVPRDAADATVLKAKHPAGKRAFAYQPVAANLPPSGIPPETYVRQDTRQSSTYYYYDWNWRTYYVAQYISSYSGHTSTYYRGTYLTGYSTLYDKTYYRGYYLTGYSTLYRTYYRGYYISGTTYAYRSYYAGTYQTTGYVRSTYISSYYRYSAPRYYYYEDCRDTYITGSHTAYYTYSYTYMNTIYGGCTCVETVQSMCKRYSCSSYGYPEHGTDSGSYNVWEYSSYWTTCERSGGGGTTYVPVYGYYYYRSTTYAAYYSYYRYSTNAYAKYYGYYRYTSANYSKYYGYYRYTSPNYSSYYSYYYYTSPNYSPYYNYYRYYYRDWYNRYWYVSSYHYA